MKKGYNENIKYNEDIKRKLKEDINLNDNLHYIIIGDNGYIIIGDNTYGIFRCEDEEE